MDPQPPAALSAGLDPEDFYFDGPLLVFTAAWHLKRGSCCGSGCRHCPYGHASVATARPAGPDRPSPDQS